MTLTRNDVAKALKKVGGVINSKDALHYLSGVMFAPGKMMATNTRQFLSVDLPGSKVTGLVNYKALDTLIKRTRDEEVSMISGEESITVETPEYSAELAYIDADLFPELDFDKAKFDSLPADFFQALALCSDAVSTDNERYVMCGIHVKGTVVEATDGHRVSRVTMSDSDFGDFIIPIEAVNLFMNLTPMEYYMGEGVMWFKGDGFVFSTVLIQGDFPPVDRVIPDKKDAISNIQLPEEVFDGSDIVEVFDNSDSGGVKHRATVLFGNGNMTITTANAQGNILFRRELEYMGDPVSFDVNLEYFLKAMKGDSAMYILPGPRVMMISGKFLSVVAGIQED